MVWAGHLRSNSTTVNEGMVDLHLSFNGNWALSGHKSFNKLGSIRLWFWFFLQGWGLAAWRYLALQHAE